MSRLQHPDNRGDGNTFVAEITRGQLIVIICLSLFVAMACFGVGILVARLDPSVKTTSVAARETDPDAEETKQMETYTTPAFGDAKEEAAATQPPRAERTPETPPPRNPYMDNTPRLTALPPLTPYRSLPVQTETPTQIPPPETPVATASVTDKPESAKPATAVPELTPIDPIEPPVNTASVTAPKPEPAKPAAATPSAPAAGKGKFGVQLAAFSGSDRRTRAESFQRRVKSELKVDAAIIPSSDDVHYRVIVGSYPTREAANAACAALKSKSGLSEAFVRPL